MGTIIRLTESQLKQIISKIITENEMNKSFDKWYGKITKIMPYQGKYSSCNSSFEVQIETEKDGAPFISMDLCLDMDVTYFERGSSPDYSSWPGEPGDPGYVEFDLNIINGVIFHNDEEKKLTDEQIDELNSDDDFMGHLYNNDKINDIAYEEGEDRGRDDY